MKYNVYEEIENQEMNMTGTASLSTSDVFSIKTNYRVVYTLDLVMASPTALQYCSSVSFKMIVRSLLGALSCASCL